MRCTAQKQPLFPYARDGGRRATVTLDALKLREEPWNQSRRSHLKVFRALWDSWMVAKSRDSELANSLEVQIRTFQCRSVRRHDPFQCSAIVINASVVWKRMTYNTPAARITASDFSLIRPASSYGSACVNSDRNNSTDTGPA